VLTNGIRAFSAPTGHLLVVQADGTLLGARFGPKSATIEGRLTPLISNLWIGAYGRTPVALSDGGTLLYQDAPPVHQVVRVGRDGVVRPVDGTWTGRFTSLALSPDGSRLAIAVEQEGKIELWVKAMPAGPLTRLAFDGTLNYRPSWSPDGQSILFISDMSGRTALYRIAADGSTTAELVHDDARAVDEGALSEDGRWLVYRSGSGGGRDVHGLRLGAESAVALAAGQFEEFSPTLSADGRWLAYASYETGRTEVYVRPFPQAASARWQVSREGGSEPTWSHTSRELFYRNAAGDLVATRIAAGLGFHVESERVLFSTREYLTDPRNRQYTVTPDDQSFLFVRAVRGTGTGSQLVVVLNWFEELKAKLN
jgi:dipeptidyl aminopeptidase/acylaminoacyl peptidase